MSKQELIDFFIHSPPYHPAILFIQFILNALIPSLPFALPAFFICVLGSLFVFRINYFWYFGIVLGQHLDYLNIINLGVFGVFSCNQRWKIPVFVYVISNQLLSSYQYLSTGFSAISIGFLLIQLYRDLPFHSALDNQLYFAGFFGLFIFSLHSFLALFLNSQQQMTSLPMILSVVLAVFCGNQLMSTRLNSLVNKNIEELESPSQMMIYIQHTRQKLRNEFQSKGIQKKHRKTCRNVACFCRDKENQISFKDMLLRELYQTGKVKFETSEYRFEMSEYEIENLLQQNMFPLAVETYIKIKDHPLTIFKWIRKKRLEAALRDELRKIQQNYDVKTVFQNAFDYEKDYEFLKRDILEIVTIKQNFWKEVCKPSSKLIVLQSLGLEIMKKFNKMHDFYQKTVKPVEDEIKVYHGSIIYNLFLLVATNYKQMAELNIKTLKKTNDSGLAQTKKDEKSFEIKVSINEKTFAQIENTTSNFLKRIKTTLPKHQFISKSMLFLIPKCYVREHVRGMRELRRYNIDNLLGDNVSPIFFVDNFGKIVPCNVVVKYSVDIFNELSIIGNVRELSSDCEYILLDINGKISYITSDNIDLSLAEVPEVQDVVAQFRAKWETNTEYNNPYPPIDAVKLQLRHKDISFSCELSSPLCTSFRFPNPPPIHLRIHNETQTYFMDNKLADDLELVGCMQKINNIMDQNENESQASHLTRTTEIIDIIQRIENKPTLPLFNQLMVLMIVVLGISLGCLLILHFSCNINWVAPDQTESNHFQLMNSIYKVQNYFYKILNKGLSLYAIQNNILNNTFFSQVYGSTDYAANAPNQVDGYCDLLKQALSKNMSMQDDNIDSSYYDLFYQSTIVTTPRSTQNITIQSLMYKGVMNCYEIANSHPLQMTILGFTYWTQLFLPIQNLAVKVQAILAVNLDRSQMQNIFLFSGFALIIIFLVIPIYLYDRKLDQKQNYTYELIVSLQSDLIHKELTELSDLEQTLRANNTNSTFKPVHKRTNSQHPEIIPEEEAATLLNNNSQMRASKRKRNGELDYTGFTSRRFILYLGSVLLLLCLSGVYLTKQLYIKSVRGSIKKSKEFHQWRNNRLALGINLKKLIYAYNFDDNVIDGANKTLDSWIMDTIYSRKLNYYIPDSSKTVSNCSNPTICGPSSGLADELTLSSYAATLVAEMYIGRDPAQTAFYQVVEEISDQFMMLRSYEVQNSVYDPLRILTTTRTTFFMTAIVGFVVLSIVNLFYIGRLKGKFISTSRLITLLSEDMIKKNKRVESYLQTLEKME